MTTWYHWTTLSHQASGIKRERLRIVARFAYWEIWARSTERELARTAPTDPARLDRLFRRAGRIGRLQRRIARILRRTR